jgi:hypothetical protein
MEYGGELPARVVIEYDEADQSYRTFLKTFTADGKPGPSTRLRTGFKAARYFYWEQEALEDFNGRLGR